MVEAGSAEVAGQGMAGLDDMAALEAAVAPASRLPGFVSAGTIQADDATVKSAQLSTGMACSICLAASAVACLFAAKAELTEIWVSPGCS